MPRAFIERRHDERRHEGSSNPRVANQSDVAADLRESDSELIVLLGPDVPQATYAFLSSIAEDQEQNAEPGESLMQAGTKALGDVRFARYAVAAQNQDLLAQLRANGQDESSPLSGSHSLSLPAISRATPNIRVFLTPGSSLPDVAQTHYGYQGEKTMQKIEEFNPSLHPSQSIPAFTPINLPNVATLRVIKLKKGVDPKLAKADASSHAGVLAAGSNEPGYLEHPVTITRNALASTNSGYDIDKLDDQWFKSPLGVNQLGPADVRLPKEALIDCAILDSGLDFTRLDFQNDLWTNLEAKHPPRGIPSE